MTRRGRVILRLRYALLMFVVSLLVWATTLNSARANETIASDRFVIVSMPSVDMTVIDAVTSQLAPVLKRNDLPPVQHMTVNSQGDLYDLIDDGLVDMTLSDGRAVIRAMQKNPMAVTLRVESGVTERAATVFAVQADSDITSLTDLQGRKLAYEGIWNRSGYYAPMTHLLRSGLPMHYLQNVREMAAPDRVNFVFAGDELNMVAWLERGLVDALAFNRTDWNNDEETPPDIRARLRLILDADIALNHYLTLTSRRAIQQAVQIERSLVGTRGSTLVQGLSQSEQAQIDILAETLSQSAGDALAHD